MSYNKARAEKEWLKWKEAEEKKLRELGVDEDTIQRLHTYDWEEFKEERRFLERWKEWSPDVEWISTDDIELPAKNAESLLDSIEDVRLFQALQSTDKLTLQIILLKLDGYNSREIAEKIGLSSKAVNLRMVRLRKKSKKFFRCEAFGPLPAAIY